MRTTYNDHPHVRCHKVWGRKRTQRGKALGVEGRRKGGGGGREGGRRERGEREGGGRKGEEEGREGGGREGGGREEKVEGEKHKNVQ